jgi:hypothetical protein
MFAVDRTGAQKPPRARLRWSRRKDFPGGPYAGRSGDVRPWNLTPAAMAPTPAAAAATAAAAAPAAAPGAATATTAATATADPGRVLEAGGAVFLIEQMECGEADVGHLLVAKDEAMPGPGQVVVRLRDIRGRQRRCECAPRQRKAQSGSTQRRRGSGFGRAVLSCSLLPPCHGRSLRLR